MSVRCKEGNLATSVSCEQVLFEDENNSCCLASIVRASIVHCPHKVKLLTKSADPTMYLRSLEFEAPSRSRAAALQKRILRARCSTGVCEINTPLYGAGVFNVPTPLPSFQSWRKDAQQQLTKISVYFTDRLHSPCACPWTLMLGGDGGSPTLTTSRMSAYFTDTSSNNNVH